MRVVRIFRASGQRDGATPAMGTASSEQLPEIPIFNAAFCGQNAYHAKQLPAIPTLSTHQQAPDGPTGFRRDREVVLSRIRGCFLVALVLACATAQGVGQAVVTELLNRQGATAPCVGLGPIAAPAAKKCVALFQQAGFIANKQIGYSGLTIGTTGNNDGTITAVDPAVAGRQRRLPGRRYDCGDRRQAGGADPGHDGNQGRIRPARRHIAPDVEARRIATGREPGARRAECACGAQSFRLYDGGEGYDQLAKSVRTLHWHRTGRPGCN